ncbi:MAG: ROK family protein [Eubacteriales bacterium]|nr:ROK family protein [Eubacteriales bacterium]
MDKKNITKYKILNYLLNQGPASKAELAKQQNLSMPTVLSTVNSLMELGILTEMGELESTGGRKARLVGLEPDYRYAIGANITANRLSMVLVNLEGAIIKQERIRFKFRPDVTYCSDLSAHIQSFYADTAASEKILGIGISLPGIINKAQRLLTKSHALQLENYSLKIMEQLLPLPAYFENDANAAMLAENPQLLGNAVYLSLNNTLGGSVCINGTLFTGQNQKSGEFGHTILAPHGKQCYCGKKGCADAYCAASVLTDNGQQPLEAFMEKIGKDAKTDAAWQEYLEYLAMLISNIRMAFDTDIILGGDVGGFLPDHMVELGKKVLKYNLFDGDLSYLKNCTYKKEASAVGVARHFFQELISQM